MARRCSWINAGKQRSTRANELWGSVRSSSKSTWVRLVRKRHDHVGANQDQEQSRQLHNALSGGRLPCHVELFSASFRAMMALVKAMYDAGVPLVAGTDAFPGFALHRELELYAEAGIPPAEVLQIATLGAARVMRQDRELGSIAPGKLADLVLINGDPTVRISDIRRPTLVVTRSRVYDPAALYQAVGISSN